LPACWAFLVAALSYLLDMKLYGLPREDERIVLFGIRLGEQDTLLQKPIDRYVQDALADS
jgi:hypothetical protein